MKLRRKWKILAVVLVALVLLCPGLSLIAVWQFTSRSARIREPLPPGFTSAIDEHRLTTTV